MNDCKNFPQRVCPICGSSKINVFLEISGMPVHCNVIWKTYQEALNAPRADIKLGFCNKCGHIYNVVFDSSLLHYTQNYENSLHFSPRFNQYAKSIAQKIINRFNLHNKTILEIGSGKGDFLRLLCKLGNNKGFGFDPTYVPKPEDNKNQDITFIQEFFNKKHSKYNADFICSRHTLEHIWDPLDIIRTVKHCADDKNDIIVFFEVPNGEYIVKQLAIWDIIYEHFSYFTPPSIVSAFKNAGFKIISLEREFNDQFLTIFVSNSLNRNMQSTVKYLDNLSNLVSDFAFRIENKLKEWRWLVKNLAKTNKKTVVWGAGSKGVTFLNMMHNNSNIEYAIDLNPRKHNMYIAGSGQQIRAPQFLRRYKPDNIIIMNAIYAEEIKTICNSMKIDASFLVV